MRFIIKHPIIFYLLQFTWGLPMNIFGSIIALVLLLTGHKPYLYKRRFVAFAVGKDWDGFNGGIFIFTDKDKMDYLLNHEAGHGLQNLYFGWLMIFVVSIPSVIRYWYREFKYYRKGITPKIDHYSIWFEAQANNLGRRYLNGEEKD